MSSGVGAIGLYMLVRWLIKSVEQPQQTPQPEVVKAPPLSPPVTRWTEPREILAWRAWRLGFLLRCKGGDGGPRLLSLSAPCVWNGPVVRDSVPLPTVEQPSGIYALKTDVADRVQWQNEHCWVTGTIALSGRVVEHEIGYRAERAVVRELRLGVGAHLAIRSLNKLREMIEELESRYQVTVSIGQSDREVADRMLLTGHTPQELPFVWDEHPWRVI